jgi:hypothetical protein
VTVYLSSANFYNSNQAISEEDMRKVKILFTDVHQPEYHDKNPFREGFEWGKKVILDLCVEVNLDDMFNIYIEQPEKRIRNGRVIKFSEFAIEYLEQEQKKQREARQAKDEAVEAPPIDQA